MSKEFRPIEIRLGAVDSRSAPSFVIGRDKLVELLWRRLETGSVQLVAERRMGKTWVLQLALAGTPDWAVPVLFDAQKHNSVAELVLEINQVLHEKGFVPDTWQAHVSDWFRRIVHKMRGKKIKDVEIPELESSVSILEETCTQFVKTQTDKQPILIIDEFPFLLDKLVNAESHGEATALLDSLRGLRHALSDLRMVFCGSLGLHIVLGNLRGKGYSGRPVNDMPPFEVPPLEESDAVYLAGGLLLGRGVPCPRIKQVAQEVAEGGSRVPFYIQHIVAWMSEQSRPAWTPKDAREAQFKLFDAANDPGEFRYYDDRLDQYYPEDVAAKSRAILFQLCHHEGGLEFDKLLNLLRYSPQCLETDDHEALRVLETLRDDHYLVSEGNRWRFKLEIVRAWWRHTRGGHNK